MGDYHVDRLEVYAQQCVQLTSTNRPKTFLSKTEPRLSLSEKYCGGYSSVGPPLPIPNREVKHTNADGTAPPGGRVGRCRFSDARLIKFSRASLFSGAPVAVSWRVRQCWYQRGSKQNHLPRLHALQATTAGVSVEGVIVK